MFEGRFAELVVIFVLALLILGPEKLPKVAAEFGRWVGRARSMARQFREQLEEEVRLEEVRKQKPAAAAATSTTESTAASPDGAASPPSSASEPNAAHVASAASAASAASEGSVDVAQALNPHTMASPIDVTGLPPELAQAAQSQEAYAQEVYQGASAPAQELPPAPVPVPAPVPAPAPAPAAPHQPSAAQGQPAAPQPPGTPLQPEHS